MRKTKAIFKCSEELKEKFIGSNCLLTISVGQATHEGEMFGATMDLVNRSFGSCTLLIDDSLQRHNMALNNSEDAAFFYEMSIKEGDLWLIRNEKYYGNLTIPKRIVRLDAWLKHPNFHTQLDSVTKAINHDPSYKAVFDKSTEEFLKKYCSRLSNPEKFNLERARRLSYDFIIEECTALCLWPELQCQFEAYPIRHNEAVNATRERFILPFYPNLLQALNIVFKNAQQIKPQSFVLLQDKG